MKTVPISIEKFRKQFSALVSYISFQASQFSADNQLCLVQFLEKVVNNQMNFNYRHEWVSTQSNYGAFLYYLSSNRSLKTQNYHISVCPEHK